MLAHRPVVILQLGLMQQIGGLPAPAQAGSAANLG
jgi:hypothetical protein